MLGGQKVYQEQLVLSMLLSQDTESLRHTHTHRLCKLHSQKEQSQDQDQSCSIIIQTISPG